MLSHVYCAEGHDTPVLPGSGNYVNRPRSQCPWPVPVPLSTAIQTSGAADRIAAVIIDAVGEGRPYLLMLALFLLTAALGQVVSNTATVLVVAPSPSPPPCHRHNIQPILMLWRSPVAQRC